MPPIMISSVVSDWCDVSVLPPPREWPPGSREEARECPGEFCCCCCCCCRRWPPRAMGWPNVSYCTAAAPAPPPPRPSS